MGAMVLARLKSRAWMSDTLIPVAAGLIIGEALTNIVSVIIRLSLGGAA